MRLSSVQVGAVGPGWKARFNNSLCLNTVVFFPGLVEPTRTADNHIQKARYLSYPVSSSINLFEVSNLGLASGYDGSSEGLGNPEWGSLDMQLTSSLNFDFFGFCIFSAFNAFFLTCQTSETKRFARIGQSYIRCTSLLEFPSGTLWSSHLKGSI